MKTRSKQWVVGFIMTVLLTAGQAGFDGLTTWANQAPGGSEGEVIMDFARQPGPDGGAAHQGTGGSTGGIRQGADPNDFSVSSPRLPQVPTTEAPARRSTMDSFRIWLQSLVNRFAGMARRS